MQNLTKDITLSEKSRIHFLDVSRSIAAFLVVFAHCFINNSEVRLYIYAFHMPFFFLVSGMLHKSSNYKKYFRKLLLPTVFFIAIFILLSVPLYWSGIWNYEAQFGHPLPSTFVSIFTEEVKLTIFYLVSGGKFANHYCWFLIVLFEVKILADWIIKIESKINRLLILFFYLLIFGVLVKSHTKHLWIINSFMAFPFYYIGIKSKKYLIHLTTLNKCHILFFIALIATIILTSINGRISMMGATFGRLFFPFSFVLFYINGIIGSLMIVMLSITISSFHHREGKIFTQLSKSLLSILGFQGLFIPFVYDKVSILEALLITPLIMGICYFIHILITKKIPFIYA